MTLRGSFHGFDVTPPIARPIMPDDFYPATYPATLPTGCIAQIIEIGKRREIATRSKEFCLSGWNCIGFLGRVTIGVPDGHDLYASAAGEEFTDDDAHQIEDACDDIAEQVGLCGASADAATAFDPATVMFIIQMLGEVIKLWRNHK